MIVQLNGHYLVIRPGDRRKAAPQPVKGLVLADRDGCGHAEHPAEFAVRTHPQFPDGRRRLSQCCRVLRRGVAGRRGQRPAQDDIKHLEATGDREKGNAGVDGGAHQRDLELVSRMIRPAGRAQRRHAIPPGPDVRPSGEHQPVQAGRNPAGRTGQYRREQHRDRSGPFDRPGVGSRRQRRLADPITPRCSP